MYVCVCVCVCVSCVHHRARVGYASVCYRARVWQHVCVCVKRDLL